MKNKQNIIKKLTMKLPIIFADLAHTEQGISNIAFPLGISSVASYAKKILGNKIKIDLFKYPKNLKNYLEKKNPKMVCFSNCSWTLNLSYGFAKKIKKKSPETIIIFGGPNYPNEIDEQKKFLNCYSEIDFYIKNEGEQSFVNLFEALEKFDFNIKNFKKTHTKIGNCHYNYKGNIIRGETLPRLENLDDVPSPYLSGLLDKFFDEKLIPVIQTKRGCPFNCTYCQEGQDYFSRISRFSSNRIKKELEYIAKRANVPNLMIADSNFGIYKECLEICRSIALLKKKYNWPKYIDTSLGKNKQIVSEVVSILKGNICLSVPVQSTNEEVLKNICRTNISMERMINLTKVGESFGANTFSEIILCLPEDTKDAHFKSMFDMMDIGINVVRSHQLLMLPGSKISGKKSRKNYKMITRFRIQPRCFGNYKIYNECFPAYEIDELCVANNTMSYEDYLKCRSFDLTVEIFYNNGIFQELINFLKQKGIFTSLFIKSIENKIPKSSLKELYNNFLKETDESLWKSKSELENFIKQPGMVEHYIKEELRNNEQLKYRAIAFFTKMDDLHKIAFSSAKELLKKINYFSEKQNNYINELFEFSLIRKNNLFALNKIKRKRFHYNFIALLKKNFNDDPFSYFIPKGINIEFRHSDSQKELISKYIKQFGSSINGLGFILSKSYANKFYREVKLIKNINELKDLFF